MCCAVFVAAACYTNQISVRLDVFVSHLDLSPPNHSFTPFHSFLIKSNLSSDRFSENHEIEGGRDSVKLAVSQLWNSSFFSFIVSPSDKQNMGKYWIRFPCFFGCCCCCPLALSQLFVCLVLFCFVCFYCHSLVYILYLAILRGELCLHAKC